MLTSDRMALWFAVQLNAEQKVEDILDKVINDPIFDINSSTLDSGETFLHHACQYNYVGIVRLLLQQPNIQVNVQNKIKRTPLHEACKAGHTEVVKLLLQQPNITMLADIRLKTPLDDAVASDHEFIARCLLKRLPRFAHICSHLMLEAAERNYIELLTDFLLLGAYARRENKLGKTCIELALEKGNFDIIHILMLFGALSGNIWPLIRAPLFSFDQQFFSATGFYCDKDVHLAQNVLYSTNAIITPQQLQFAQDLLKAIKNDAVDLKNQYVAYKTLLSVLAFNCDSILEVNITQDYKTLFYKLKVLTWGSEQLLYNEIKKFLQNSEFATNKNLRKLIYNIPHQKLLEDLEEIKPLLDHDNLNIKQLELFLRLRKNGLIRAIISAQIQRSDFLSNVPVNQQIEFNKIKGNLINNNEFNIEIAAHYTNSGLRELQKQIIEYHNELLKQSVSARAKYFGMIFSFGCFYGGLVNKFLQEINAKSDTATFIIFIIMMSVLFLFIALAMVFTYQIERDMTLSERMAVYQKCNIDALPKKFKASYDMLCLILQNIIKNVLLENNVNVIALKKVYNTINDPKKATISDLIRGLEKINRIFKSLRTDTLAWSVVQELRKFNKNLIRRGVKEVECKENDLPLPLIFSKGMRFVKFYPEVRNKNLLNSNLVSQKYHSLKP